MPTTFTARAAAARATNAAFAAVAAVAASLAAAQDGRGVAAPVAAPVAATAAPPADEARTLERITVTGGRPSTLPLAIPTTTESIDAERIARSINATDAEDALKYFPSLSVRRRYIGDYDHAVLATRASGTGNSARSLVYADGVLLSNLLGNGAGFTPRWGLVTPEEIARVDVLYGPFSAAYPGNSAGAVVDYVTRMPDRFEAHLKLQGFTQDYRLYGTSDRFSGHQASASLGSRSGDFAWWLNVNRLRSDSQPIVFANRLVAAGVPAAAGSAGVPVSGAVAGRDPRNRDWLLFGDGQQTRTTQDHAKLKLAWDVTPAVRASYTLAWWRNTAERNAETYLRDAAGQPVYSGAVSVDGRSYTLVAADLTPTTTRLEHLTHGLSLKRQGGGSFDWEAAASWYDYAHDQVRSPTVALPAAADGGAGRIADQGGTGWTTLALKGIWRPEGTGAQPGGHVVEFGGQRDAFRLRSRVAVSDDWQSGRGGTRFSAFEGDTTLTSAWAQDAWRFAPRWRSVAGLRLEHWRADHGLLAAAAPTDGSADVPQRFAPRSENHVSPKAAIAYAVDEAWTLKTSVGRAVRMPTVSELYQGSIVSNAVVNNDPNLRPEKSWTGELSSEWLLAASRLRATLFAESTRDALYSQTNATVTPAVTNIQNVGRIRSRGVELAGDADDLGLRGLTAQGSVTWVRSKIISNDAFPASVGKDQPRVPSWRASALLSYAWNDAWSTSLGARYSGKQYGQLDNGDVNGSAYTGFGRFLVADARMQLRLDRNWSASVGVDNLSNETYWAFHPYPQRTWHAELKWDR